MNLHDCFLLKVTHRSIKKKLLAFLQPPICWKLTETTDWFHFCFHLFFLHISESNYVEEVKGYTVSNMGRAMLVDQRNYTYLLHQKAAKRIFWKCRKYRKMCKARASTCENYIMMLSGVHNHDPDEVPEILKKDNEISCWIFSVVFKIHSITT